MKKVVFISHSAKDGSVASRILRFLEERGCPCWVAPRDIKPGLPYGEAILAGIRSSAVLLVIVSSRSTSSPHVRREVEAATSLDMPILPVVIDSAPIPDAMLYYLGDHQRIGAAEDLDASLPNLWSSVQDIAARRIADAGSESGASSDGVNSENRNPRLGPHYALVITDPQGSTWTHPLAAARLVVGRSRDADIRVMDRHFSRNQFALRFNESLNTFDVIDFGTVHGVFVNGERIGDGRAVPLDVFDVIRSGDTSLEFIPVNGLEPP